MCAICTRRNVVQILKSIVGTTCKVYYTMVEMELNTFSPVKLDKITPIEGNKIVFVETIDQLKSVVDGSNVVHMSCLWVSEEGPAQQVMASPRSQWAWKVHFQLFAYIL